MAAPNDLQKGTDLLVLFGAQTVGGRRDVTLSQVADMLDITDSASADWRQVKAGAKSWTLPLGLFLVEGTEKLTGCPTFKVAADGGTLTTLSMMKSVKLNATSDMLEIANCSTATAKKYLAGKRSLTVDVSYDFLDFGGAGQNQAQHLAVLAAYEGGTKLDWKIEIGTGVSFTGEGYVSKLDIIANNGEVITVNATIEVHGAITRAGTLDVGIEEVLDAIFDTVQTAKAVVLQNTSASGSVKWTGTAWVTQLGIELGFNQLASVSASLQGNGALTRSTVA